MRKGMSLVEVMVSMVILGLVVAGIYATFSVVGKATGKVGNLKIQATNYARETLERLRNVVSTDPIHSAPLVPGTHDDPLPDGDFKNKYGGTRSYTVTNVDKDTPPDGITDYKKVTVTVRWND